MSNLLLATWVTSQRLLRRNIPLPDIARSGVVWPTWAVDSVRFRTAALSVVATAAIDQRAAIGSNYGVPKDLSKPIIRHVE